MQIKSEGAPTRPGSEVAEPLLPLPLSLPQCTRALAKAVADAGGRLWLVGGFVRDRLLGRPSKDIDLEVHGVEAAALEPLLRRLGRVVAVGKSFGVYKLHADGQELDVALPRGDSVGGLFGEVRHDPGLGIEAAARRRDLSVNAMALDPLTGELADPCGGLPDLRAGRLRAADPARFGDDPLRVLRACRFAAQLGFHLDPALQALGRTLPIEALPPERVVGELEKLLLAPFPALGWAAGRAMEVWSRVLPERGESADDGAWERLPALRDRCGPPPRPLALGWAVALRDSSPLAAQALLDRLRVRLRDGYPLRDQVLTALRCWSALDDSDPGLRRLADQGEVALITTVGLAISGEPRFGDALDRAEALGLSLLPLPPLLYGRDLAALGVPAGRGMGELLSSLRAAQLEGQVSTPEEARGLLRRLWSPG